MITFKLCGFVLSAIRQLCAVRYCLQFINQASWAYPCNRNSSDGDTDLPLAFFPFPVIAPAWVLVPVTGRHNPRLSDNA